MLDNGLHHPGIAQRRAHAGEASVGIDEDNRRIRFDLGAQVSAVAAIHGHRVAYGHSAYLCDLRATCKTLTERRERSFRI